MRTLSLMLALSVLGTGCNQVGLADSVDLEWNWAPLVGPSDELHMPYAAGADFHVYTVNVDEDDREGWTIRSSDASVLRVDDTADGTADVTATGAGVATVSIHDASGEPVHEIELDVRQPTRAELFAHGAMIIDRPELQEEWDTIFVLDGGSATFEVRWFDGEDRLFGAGALSAVAEGEITVEPRRTFLFEDREWITFTPHAAGSYDVELRANGAPVRTVRVVAVTHEAIQTVLLHGMDESAAREGDLMTVLAQAYDAEGQPVFGVEYSWALDGEVEEGLGDLFRYELVPGAFRMLGARSDVMGAEVMIQANEGYVDSTNRLGCSAARVGMRAHIGLAPIALGVGLLTLARRRRR